jgi:hypothetical protein
MEISPKIRKKFQDTVPEFCAGLGIAEFRIKGGNALESLSWNVE